MAFQISMLFATRHSCYMNTYSLPGAIIITTGCGNMKLGQNKVFTSAQKLPLGLGTVLGTAINRRATLSWPAVYISECVMRLLLDLCAAMGALVQR
jgi:hypothetical protein